MYPMTSDDGVTFIVDDWKAPLWIMQSAFDFLQAAEAGRKFIAIGTISDYGGTTASVYSRVARAALDVADHVLFVRSEEHTSELQSLMRISYAVFCLKNKKQ